ncbi:DUF3140 domain-containing protein [Pseudonocardia sp. KRD291]|uniref:DUF3140 domain-containing protein n=1 Tax=Pseudonocardia sp. KRD291 TaxID=2792007 RepID=UPI001C49E184|nr:DUF3140 domain-containing protein [Pseudonocardia sp. KRD291]MBW0104391.1 DUF3140 domain-containing protein [Pseudonocardia sp. KRD291]
MATDESTVRDEFDDAVNMTPKELERWLDTDEAKAVGDTGGNGESTGHQMGRRILELQRTKAGDLGDDDLAAMRKVTGYVHRHLAQPPKKQDVETSKWRYSLMNWGHDPLK